MNKYGKEYYEEYALLTLEEYKTLKSLFIHADRPDIQSSKLNTGIEVTRAINPEAGEIIGVVNEYFGKKYSQKYIQRKVNRRLHKTIIHVSKDGIAYYKYSFCEEDTKNRIINSMKEKTEKLNDGYRIFKENDLYIFIGTSLIFEETLNSIWSWYKKENYKIKFDRLFINSIDKLYELSSDGLKCHIISDENQKEYNCEALK